MNDLSTVVRYPLWAFALMAGLTAGCGDELDRVSKVKTVRVLGVRKLPSYPAPGETVEYQILWHDGRPAPQRSVSLTWLGGCTNPAGDQFVSCFDALDDTRTDQIVTGTGQRFSFTMPEDAISSRPPPAENNQAPFATSFVFFAACAGTVAEDPTAEAFPIGCFDDNGSALGADDFVFGYTRSFITETQTNAEPSVEGFRVQGNEVAVDCIDEACLEEEERAPIACPGDPRCVQACSDDGDEDTCPELRIEPVLSAAAVERDPSASERQGREVYEQVWVDYFSDGGRIGQELTLVATSEEGPRDDWSSEFYAPAQVGPVLMWAVVKDSRGGVSWVRLRLQVY